MENNDNNIIDYTIDGKCPDDCSKCCTSILPLSLHEITKIRKVIKRKGIEPVVRNGNINEDKYIDICPFLNKEGKCNIYVHRPEVCSYFTCHGTKEKFNHNDKMIVNMYSAFFPEVKLYKAPDVEQLDKGYQLKKKQIENLIKSGIIKKE